MWNFPKINPWIIQNVITMYSFSRLYEKFVLKNLRKRMEGKIGEDSVERREGRGSNPDLVGTKEIIVES